MSACRHSVFGGCCCVSRCQCRLCIVLYYEWFNWFLSWLHSWPTLSTSVVHSIHSLHLLEEDLCEDCVERCPCLAPSSPLQRFWLLRLWPVFWLVYCLVIAWSSVFIAAFALVVGVVLVSHPWVVPVAIEIVKQGLSTLLVLLDLFIVTCIGAGLLSFVSLFACFVFVRNSNRIHHG